MNKHKICLPNLNEFRKKDNLAFKKIAQTTFTDSELVHKKRAENVLITNLSCESGMLNNDFDYDYISDLIVNKNHPFFFEHENNHIPGLLLIEAARQNAMATAHKYIDIPLDTSFVMNEINCRFVSFGKLKEPVKVYTSIIQSCLKSKRKLTVTLKTKMVQGDKEIFCANGGFMTLPTSILKRLESEAN